MKNEVNRTFTVKKNKFTNFLSCFYANTPQNLGGGNSHSSTVVTPVWKGGRPTVSRRSTDSQSQDHRNHTPISKALKYAAMILMILTLGVGNAWGGTITWNTADNSGKSDVSLSANYAFTGDDASTTLTYANPNGCKRLKSSGGLYMNGASSYGNSKNQRHFTFKAPSATGTVSITFAAINGKNDGTGSATVRIYGGTTVAYDVNTLNSSLTSPVIEGLKTGTSDVIITFSAKCTIKEIKWTDVASTTYTTVYANDFTASPMGAAAVSYSNMSAMASAVTGWTGWDNTYAKGYASSSSSCSATLTFATPLALNSDGTDCGRIRVFWGHSSNNKTLGLKVNGSSVTFSPTTVATTIYPTMLNVAEYTIPKTTTTISSIQPSGSGSTITYLFRIEVLTHASAGPTCEDAPTVSSITKGATTATTQVVNCAGISSLGSEGCTISSYGFVYGTSANPTISDTKVQVGTTYTTTGTAFATTTLTGLTPSTTYYVRAYATNGAGTAYSSGDSFTTPSSIGNVVYIAGSADASNDAIKALRDANYVVTVRTKAASPDYTGVDLVVLDESLSWANSDEGGSVIAADVPILNLKAFFYTLSSRWNWGTPVNPSPKSELATLSTEYSNVSSHPIFDGVTISEGAVDMIGTAKDGNNLQGVTTSTLVSGKEGYTLATSADGTTCIHELTPAQRGVTNSKYLLIALSNNVKDNYSADAKKMIVNAAAYLIDNSEQWEPAAPSCAATAEAGADKSTTVGEGVAMAATAATSGYTGAWSIKAGSPSSDAGQLGTTSSNTMTFTPNNTGTYTLVWTVTDDNDNTCYATDEATVTVTAPTHSVSAITSTGNNTYGSVSAASATVAEGSTVLITAVPATGYRVANWAVSGTGATISPSGASNSLTTTLTMGTADATVTVTFEEIPCPTSGTLYSLEFVNEAKVTMSDGDNLALTSTYATITGGSASIKYFKDGNTGKEVLTTGHLISYGTNDMYLKLNLNCPLAAGDEINFANGDGVQFVIATDDGTPKDATHKVTTTSYKYTVIADDVLEGQSVFYVGRSDGSTTKHGAVTITRPAKYAVTYESEKGEAPAGGTVSSVTLAEITGVSGWKNTGWKANVATEVGGESVDANTLIANGSVVTLSGATTFTAQWAQLYAIETGSPAHGTVAADKTSAAAGETIKLTATPEDGYKLSAWDVYKTGEESTKVSVTNNQFTMPAYGVTISAEFVESVVLYDYSVMDNKSFTGETVDGNQTGKSKTFGSEGNPQLVVTSAGWDKKDNIINSFIKLIGGTTNMSVVIPAGRKATVTIKYGSYDADGKYLQVNGTNQAKPVANMNDDDGMTTETFGNYMRTVELTNQTGTLALTASTGNIYIAYVDVTLTGYASYGITYHLNDGAWDGDAGAATYTYGTGIASLARNVTKTGYDFAGWYGNEGLTGDEITSIANNVAGDKELWAKWTPKSYTLTWNWNGGECSGVAGTDYTAGGSVAYGTTLVYPEASAMSKADAAFAGWSSTPATMPAEALTITAQWAPEHAISYKEVKGSDISAYPTTYVQGVGVASFEPLADVADFHFTGWSPASIGTDATEDVDVTAQWVAAYNVSFSAGEGSGTVPATFQKWATATFELPGQGLMVAPEGKVFVGWKANGAGETRAEGYEYTMTAEAVEFVAQWKAVTLLINYDGENYSLNTTDFQTDLDLVDGVDGTGYEKQAKVKNNITGISNYDNLGKGVMYHSKTNATKVTLYMYNNYTGNNTSTFYYTVVAEGETSSPSVTSESLTKNTGDSYEINMTGRSTLYVFCGQKELRISQIEVEENGTANKVAPEVGYSVNLNKQRSFLPSGVATTFEGITYRVSSNYKPVNGQVQISTCGTDYYSFTIPVGQARQLQLTVSGSSKYVVSQTLGDNTESKKVSGNQNINLTSGTWYINPQGSNVNITNIAFAAAPAQKSVTFKDGSTTLDTKYVWSGDAVAALNPAPTKSGYRFVKWQLGGEDYNFSTPVTDDIVLDAVWQQVWTVTFDSDGGSDVAAATVDNGAAVAKPADPTKVGFDFVEWQLNSAAYNFASAVTSNITLVATWVVAQTDASLSALSYNSNAIDVNSAVEIEGVQTYTVHLQWGSTVDDNLISVTKSAETATVSEISYDSENLKATFSVESGNHTVTINYAIQFVIDAKRGTSIVKAVVSGGDQKAGFAATGIYGDKGYAYTRNNKKLDTADKFVGVKLISGKTFEAGDKLFVVTSTDADMGYIEIYEEAEGTNLIKATGVRDASEGIEVPELAGYSEFYIVRKASTGDQAWNGFVDYVEVLREMNPAIKSFKFGDDAATINESAKTISIEVPYATDVTALTPTVEAYGNNGATYTPEGATDFTSPIDYVVTDGYSEFQTTYAVTVNVAAPSENAYLASLSVAGYALDFNKEVENYSIVLNYGTTVLPEITYTVEDAGLATAVKVEGGVNGTTTITVTPQAGAGYEKVYSINFSVNRTPTVAVFDGRTMDAAVVEYTDATSGLSWTNEGAATTSSGNTKTINGRTYTKSVKIFGSATNESRYLKITVPENYMAKFYLAGSTNSSTGSETLFFADEITADKTKSIAGITASVDDPKWVETDYLYSGDYYFCVTGSARIYELSVTLYHIDFTRATTAGRLGTICLEKGGTMRGATLYEVAYFNPSNQKIYFDEVLGGEMEPGMPYVFIPEEDNNNQLVVMYGNNVPAAVAGHHNGLYGSFTREELTPNDGNYIFQNNLYWYVNSDEIYVGQNRAYLKVAQITGYNGEPEPTPAPGRRRVTMDSGDQAPQITTGLENLHAGDQPVKMLINGQIFILRGEKMFDVTGKLVK